MEWNECKRKRSGLMFKVPSQRLPGGTQVNHEKSVRKTGVRAEVRNPNLYNKLYAPRHEITRLVMESYESRAGIGRSRPVSRLRPASAWRERKITHPLSTTTLDLPIVPTIRSETVHKHPKSNTKISDRQPFTESHLSRIWRKKNNSILLAFSICIFIYVAFNDAVTISDERIQHRLVRRLLNSLLEGTFQTIKTFNARHPDVFLMTM